MVRLCEGRRDQNAWKHWCFQALLVSLTGGFPLSQAEGRIWKTPFGKHRLFGAPPKNGSLVRVHNWVHCHLRDLGPSVEMPSLEGSRHWGTSTCQASLGEGPKLRLQKIWWCWSLSFFSLVFFCVSFYQGERTWARTIFRNLEKEALEKGYLHKIVRNWLSNSRQICDNFAHPSSDVRNEMPAIYSQIWRAICDKFAQDFRWFLQILAFS